ncbi:ROK family transcriptional regulator [Timonella senegalensis]|uniref:ROK family transcriptional regulator n=1 Tax=Timonella senegalensis TaxID=1465825 RepID=UPI00058C475C|nr:ROK family transcriptional regulator [Timonella senegalensis]
MTSIASSTGRRANGARVTGGSSKILPVNVRQLHRSLVLQELYKKDPASRADLARATGLTRVTISDVVTDLMERDLIEEIGPRPGVRVGKPATLVDIKYDAHNIVCLDLSNENEFRGAVVSLGGEILTRDSIQLDGEKGDKATARVITLAKKLVAAASAPVLGVGIGTPGIVNAEGLVHNAPNLGWTDVDLPKIVSTELELPTYVANDADTAALAENTFGEGDGSGLILVQISRGVGAGILCDGRLLRGPDGTAGEIGHVKISGDGLLCSCGRTDCLEAYINSPRLRSLIRDQDEETTHRELTLAGQRLGDVVAPIAQALGLHDIVLFGAMELLDGPLRVAAEERVNANTSHFSNKPIVLRMAALDREGVLTGAAAHVLGGELGLS